MIRAISIAAILSLIPLMAAFRPSASPDTRIGSVSIPGLDPVSIPWERFEKIHAAVAPSGERERWAEIPWQTDLAAARRQAAREKKAILMWVMDGHPLGCT